MDRTTKRARGGGDPSTPDSDSTSLDASASASASFKSTSPPPPPPPLPPPQSGAIIEERKVQVRARVEGSPDESELLRPRSVRPSGGKDRHSKVQTAKGLRDRRVRLSVATAIQFYDVQDRLGFDQPSKAVEWLLGKAKHAIDELPPLPRPGGATPPPPLVQSPFQAPGGSPSSGGGGFSTRFYPGGMRSAEAEATAAAAMVDVAAQQVKGEGSQGRMESRVKARERARERMKERSTTIPTMGVLPAPGSASTAPPPLRGLDSRDSPGERLLEGGGGGGTMSYSSFTSLLQSPVASVHAPLSSLIHSLQSPHLYHSPPPPPPPFHLHHHHHYQQQQQLQVEGSGVRHFHFNPSLQLHGSYGGAGAPPPPPPPPPSLGDFPSYSGSFGGGNPEVSTSPFVLVSSSVNQYRPIPSMLEETYMQAQAGRSLQHGSLGGVLPLQYEPQFQGSYDFVSALDRGGSGAGVSGSSRLAPGALYQPASYHAAGAPAPGMIQELEEEEDPESLGERTPSHKRNNQS